MQPPQNFFTDSVSHSQSPLNPTNDGSLGTSIPNLGPFLTSLTYEDITALHAISIQHTESQDPMNATWLPLAVADPSLDIGWTNGDDTPSISLPYNGTSPPPESEFGQFSLDPAPTIPPQEAPPAPPPHQFIQVEVIAKASNLKVYMIKTTENGKTYHRCDYPGCSHVDPFRTAKQTVSHIRRVHIRERPFECTTCGRRYAYIQDAERHVNTTNNGKVYECAVCHKRYARKDYRDKHQKLHEIRG